jgi:chemotaxis protein methyltransferase CheR
VVAIQEASRRIGELARDRATIAPPAPSQDGGGRSPPGALAQAPEPMPLEPACDAVEQSMARRPDGADEIGPLLRRATLLTNRGQTREAEALCRDVLARDELNAGAHYLLALCCEHEGQGDAAADHDRYALFLDPSFAMPRLHLGLMARHSGDLELARRELQQASMLLANEDASRIGLLGGGLTREGLLAVCNTELRACGGGTWP